MTIPTHPDLAVRITAGDDDNLWVELRGVADLANHDHLQAALAEIALEGDTDVHLRLSQLTFCDTRALCHLVAFATRVHRSGQRMTTHGASHTVRKMTDVLGANTRLNLV